MKNQAIKVLNKEHGKKVSEYLEFMDKYNGYVNGEPNYTLALTNYCAVNGNYTWDFVEKYLPRYYNRNDVALSDDLAGIIELEGEVELESCAYRVLQEMCDGDLAKAKELSEEIDEDIYKEAILNYIDLTNE